MTEVDHCRFVILHHQIHDSEHWDLMLEHGDSLLTWQLPLLPDSLSRVQVSCRRLADHRKEYLTYEGPVSKNRGTVTRVDSGPMIILELTDRTCRFELQGLHFSGSLMLEHLAEDNWTLHRI